jgi:GNAT superfamily N-acetyltransferase
MFSIRRIYDDVLPVNRAAIADVQQILSEQFSGVRRSEIEELSKKLRDPFQHGFRMVLYVAENARGRVIGFALMLHDPQAKFCYLDYIATVKGIVGRGIGAALYERVRDDALWLGAEGLFFECLPDTPDRCKDPVTCRQNAARLRFYETYGARPIVNTAYESAFDASNADNLPYLMFDPLDRDELLRRDLARTVARRVLQSKYARICSPEYIRKVVDSFQDDPVRLREPRHVASSAGRKPAAPRPPELIAVAINDNMTFTIFVNAAMSSRRYGSRPFSKILSPVACSRNWS